MSVVLSQSSSLLPSKDSIKRKMVSIVCRLWLEPELSEPSLLPFAWLLWLLHPGAGKSRMWPTFAHPPPPDVVTGWSDRLSAGQGFALLRRLKKKNHWIFFSKRVKEETKKTESLTTLQKVWRSCKMLWMDFLHQTLPKYGCLSLTT